MMASGQTNNNNLNSTDRNHAGAGGDTPPSGRSSSGGSSVEYHAAQEGGPPTEIPPGPMKVGKCKWFNVVKGWGFITPDDPNMQEVFVHQSVLKMPGFRSLGENEGVEFKWKESDKGLEATYATGVGGGDCKGSQRRLHNLHRKKPKRIRCYNCGEFANHIAAKCNLGPQPKRCHQCKSTDHLIADCPDRPPSINSSPADPHTDTPVASSSSSTASSGTNHCQRGNGNNNDASLGEDDRRV